MASWYFRSWDALWQVAASGALLYVGLVVLLRIGGKRTLGRFTIFDWAVSVAFGSSMATAMTSSSVSVADGLAAFAVLVALQTIVALLHTHVPGARSVLSARPRLIAYHGELDRSAMRRERIAEADVAQALRQAGYRNLADAAAVVLETTGDLTVVSAGDGQFSTLDHVEC